MSLLEQAQRDLASMTEELRSGAGQGFDVICAAYGVELGELEDVARYRAHVAASLMMQLPVGVEDVVRGAFMNGVLLGVAYSRAMERKDV